MTLLYTMEYKEYAKNIEPPENFHHAYKKNKIKRVSITDGASYRLGSASVKYLFWQNMDS